MTGPQPGTCTWISDNPTFRDWITAGTNASVLCITGGPGCGKSCLAKYLTEYLSSLPEPNKIALSFFCNVAITSQKTPAILEYFVKALILWKPALYRNVPLRYLDRDTISEQLSMGTLIEILRNIIVGVDSGVVYFLIDGLDERDSSYIQDLLQRVDWALRMEKDKFTRGQYPLKIIITCRPTQDILRWSSTHTHIGITTEDIAPDIAAFVDAQIHRIARIKYLGGYDPNDVSETITELADGFFLWARNAIIAIETSEKTGKQDILHAITSCPRSLGEYYDEELVRLPKAPQPDAIVREALKLVVIAREALTASELLDAISILYSSDFTDVDLASLFRKWCSRLVRVTTKESVHIVHYTLIEHLSDSDSYPGDWDFQNLNALMAKVCMDTLQRPVVLDRVSGLFEFELNNTTAQKIHDWSPFLMYAAFNWSQHVAGSGPVVEQLIPSLQTFLSSGSIFYSFWDDLTDWCNDAYPRAEATPLWWMITKANAANVLPWVIIVTPDCLNKWNSLSYLEQLWSDFCSKFFVQKNNIKISEKDWNRTDSSGRTLLHSAASIGSVDFVKYHIQRNQGISERDPHIQVTALHLAAASETKTSAEVVRLLLDAGAEANDKAGRGFTPLYLACLSGNVDKVRCLLEAGATVNHWVDEEVTPLELALEIGNPALVHVLVNYGALLDLWLSDGSTPIMTAIENNQDEIFLALLDGSDVNQCGSRQGAPLHLAIAENRIDWVERILEKGADINLINQWGKWKVTGLILAIWNRNPSTVEKLLQAGADPDLHNGDLWTPLHVAVGSGSLDMVKLLVQHGCCINTLDLEQRSPLRIASWEGKEDITHFLLENGADASWEEGTGVIGPLHVAVFYGHSSIVSMLFESTYPPNVNYAPKSWEAPLYYAVLQGCQDIVQTLLASGANANYADKTGRSLLLEATKGDSVEIVNDLLHNKASPRGSEQSMWTPLHEAASKGRTDMVELLLARKSEGILELQGGKYGTPLYQACLNGSFEIFEQLVANGARTDVIIQPDGLTALHAACMGGDIRIVEWLLNNSTIPVDSTSNISLLTPLMAACVHGSREIVRSLLRNGADWTKRTKPGTSIIALAAANQSAGKISLLSMLLRWINVDDAGEDNQTALFTACSEGDLQCTRYLLRNGADPNKVPAKPGSNCLHIAAYYGFYEIAALLIADHRVRLTSTDQFGFTPLHRALGRNNRSIATLILCGRKPGPHISQSEIETEIMENLGIMDAFGRTPLDVVFNPGAALSERDCARLKRNISAEIKALVESFTPGSLRSIRNGESMGRLSKHLAKLGTDDANAVSAYQYMTNYEEDVLCHSVVCDNCPITSGQDNITGVRYVCRACSDLDLCAACKSKFDLGQTGHRLTICQSYRHSFLEVPAPDSAKWDADEFFHWLLLLDRRYEQGNEDPSHQSTGISRTGTGSTESGTSELPLKVKVLLTALNHLGFLTIQTVGVRIPLLLTTQVTQSLVTMIQIPQGDTEDEVEEDKETNNQDLNADLAQNTSLERENRLILLRLTPRTVWEKEGVEEDTILPYISQLF